jgi:exo-beta-1,3-glucanase (GH17 family)
MKQLLLWIWFSVLLMSGQAMAADQPKVVDKPATADQPKAVDKPASTDQPEIADKPVKTDQPKAADKPAQTDQPGVSDQPETEDQPAAEDQAENTDKPIAELQHKENAPAIPFNERLQCAAFSPYVGELSPDYGAHPSRELINELLDKLVEETPFRCIMTYGVMNGLEYVFAAAEARNIKVIAIIWLDDDVDVNTQSIHSGIEVARAFPQTIVKLSCGSEVRTRHGNAFDGEITRCIDSLRQAGVTQPITTIDTWWEWCNRSRPCRPSSFGKTVDWIGTNIFPWWENKHSAIFPCTTAKKAPDFHIARLKELRKTYPKKDVILTEFGWPNGPAGGTEYNIHTRQHCGVAGKKNQLSVVEQTFKKLAKNNWSGVVFEAFSENWKPSNEGSFGSYWGICEGTSPYACAKELKISPSNASPSKK